VTSMKALFLLLAVLVPSLALAQANGPQLTRAPELVQFVEAPYPESELAERRNALVVVAVTISETGTVEEATVHQSAGEAFDRAALEAVRQFAFTPAEVDGVPSRVQILYQYQFAPPPEPVKHAVFAGRVVNRSGGAGLAGIEVRLASGQTATSD